MIVQCDGCQAQFRLRDDKVTPAGARLRCPKCQHVFWVNQGPFEEFGAAPSLSDDEITRPAGLKKDAKASQGADDALFDARWDNDENSEPSALLDVPELKEELFDLPKRPPSSPNEGQESRAGASSEKTYRAPSFQRRNAHARVLAPVFHGFMVLVLLGVGAWALREKNNASSEWAAFWAPQTPEHRFEVSNLSSNVVETRAGRLLWVVSGVAHSFSGNDTMPEVTIEIWHSGRVLKKRQGLFAPPPTPKALHALQTPQALKDMLQKEIRQHPSASEDMFFWAVFDELPRDLKDARVTVHVRPQS